jgi:hypothetical protein
LQVGRPRVVRVKVVHVDSLRGQVN